MSLSRAAQRRLHSSLMDIAFEIGDEVAGGNRLYDLIATLNDKVPPELRSLVVEIEGLMTKWHHQSLLKAIDLTAATYSVLGPCEPPPERTDAVAH